MVLCAVRLAPCPPQPLLLFTGLFSSPTPLFKFFLKIYLLLLWAVLNCVSSVFNTWMCPGLIDKVGVGHRLDSVILKVFSNINDSMSAKPITVRVEIKIVDIKEIRSFICHQCMSSTVVSPEGRSLQDCFLMVTEKNVNF